MTHYFPPLVGATSLLLLAAPADGSSAIALWGIVITTVGSIILQVLRSKSDTRKAEQQHRFQMDSARQAAADRESLAQAIAENTAFTRQGIRKADEAYKVANNVNEKIASLGLEVKGGTR